MSTKNINEMYQDEIIAECKKILDAAGFKFIGDKGFGEIYGIRGNLRIDLEATPGHRILIDFYKITQGGASLDFLWESYISEFEVFKVSLEGFSAKF